MTVLLPHAINATDEAGHQLNQYIALVHDASPAAVAKVIFAHPLNDDGRSQWVWVRLQNGDLILGVMPQGDTHFAVEEDAVQHDVYGNYASPLADVGPFVRRYREWLDSLERDESGEIVDLARYDENRADFGEEALDLLESFLPRSNEAPHE